MNERVMKKCDVVEVLNNCVVEWQYVRFQHGNNKTMFVRCDDFVAAYHDFVQNNHAMGGNKSQAKVERVIPSKCKFNDGEEGFVLTIVLERKDAVIWQCVNSIESDEDEPRPMEK